MVKGKDQTNLTTMLKTGHKPQFRIQNQGISQRCDCNMTTSEIISAAFDRNCLQYKRLQHDYDLKLSYMDCPIINTIKLIISQTSFW